MFSDAHEKQIIDLYGYVCLFCDPHGGGYLYECKSEAAVGKNWPLVHFIFLLDVVCEAEARLTGQVPSNLPI